MKLWQVLEQGDSGILTHPNENTAEVIWKRSEVANAAKTIVTLYSGINEPVIYASLADFYLEQLVEHIPGKPYTVKIKSMSGDYYELTVCKHVPHIPEEPSDELYVFEIKTLIHVKAESLEDAYNQLPDHIRASANDIVCEYNEEETLAARGELK